MTSILVLPDSHAKPEVSNERYDWLARMILDRRPDYVVDIGDFADMESLSSYDKGKLSGQNRYLERDIIAARDARKRLTQPIQDLQAKAIANHKKLYIPRLVAMGGNHEHRVDRYINDHPELKDVWTQDISNAAGFGWEWHDFQDKVVIEGINFRHYFQKEGKPVSGVVAARSLLQKGYESAVAGHSHKWGHFEDTTWSGRRIHGLIVGCYFGHEEAYAGTSNSDWWRGITLLTNVKEGDYSLSKISYEEIRYDYGRAA